LPTAYDDGRDHEPRSCPHVSSVSAYRVECVWSDTSSYQFFFGPPFLILYRPETTALLPRGIGCCSCPMHAWIFGLTAVDLLYSPRSPIQTACTAYLSDLAPQAHGVWCRRTKRAWCDGRTYGFNFQRPRITGKCYLCLQGISCWKHH
jgi:hypothetical protein